jgi:hypothetical protein
MKNGEDIGNLKRKINPQRVSIRTISVWAVKERRKYLRRGTVMLRVICSDSAVHNDLHKYL